MKQRKKQSGLPEKLPEEKIKLVMERKRLLFEGHPDIMEPNEKEGKKEVAK